MTVKLLTEHHLELLSLKRGFTGSYQSTLVKMRHYCKSDVVAHIAVVTFSLVKKEDIAVAEDTQPIFGFGTCLIRF